MARGGYRKGAGRKTEYGEPVRKVLIGLPLSVLKALDKFADAGDLSRPKAIAMLLDQAAAAKSGMSGTAGVAEAAGKAAVQSGAIGASGNAGLLEPAESPEISSIAEVVETKDKNMANGEDAAKTLTRNSPPPVRPKTGARKTELLRELRELKDNLKARRGND